VNKHTYIHTYIHTTVTTTKSAHFNKKNQKMSVNYLSNTWPILRGVGVRLPAESLRADLYIYIYIFIYLIIFNPTRHTCDSGHVKHNTADMGTPTCHSISSYSIPFHLTALLPLSVPKSPHTDPVNGSLTATANHSLTPSFSVYFHEQRKRPSQARPGQARPGQARPGQAKPSQSVN